MRITCLIEVLSPIMKPPARLMSTGIIFLGLSVLSISLLSLVDASAEMETSFILKNGYRVDDLDFNIAGDITGNNPNILSELTWSDLKIYQVKADAAILLDERYYLRGSIGYGWILDGENQDSDYLGDNRTLEFSRSNASADNGNVMDVSAGVGYQFKPGSGRLKVTPLVGYSSHEQNLTMTDGVQTINVLGSFIGPFSGLNATYDTEWKGLWAGVDLSIEASKSLTLFGSFEYHRADYKAEANWNLRDDLAHPKSFEHSANGKGVLVSAGGIFTINDHWRINANVDYQDWSTDAGVDLVFSADGTTAATRLNEVNWSSFATMLGIMYRF